MDELAQCWNDDRHRPKAVTVNNRLEAHGGWLWRPITRVAEEPPTMVVSVLYLSTQVFDGPMHQSDRAGDAPSRPELLDGLPTAGGRQTDPSRMPCAPAGGHLGWSAISQGLSNSRRDRENKVCRAFRLVSTVRLRTYFDPEHQLEPSEQTEGRKRSNLKEYFFCRPEMDHRFAGKPESISSASVEV